MSALNPSGQFCIDIDNVNGAFSSSGSIQVKAIDQALNQIPGILVNDIKLTDLIFPADICNGLYLFYEEDSNVPIYVGKADGRSLIERIAGHFNTRKNDWMNNLMKKIARVLFNKEYSKDVVEVEIEEAIKKAVKLRIKLILFHRNQNAIIKVAEKELIKYYKPRYNR